MHESNRDLILPDVPRMNFDEHPDVCLEALSIAASYGEWLPMERFPKGVYAHLSGYTGRCWLIGFDDKSWGSAAEEGRHPDLDFAALSLPSYLQRPETLVSAIEHLGRQPELLWNVECRYDVDADVAAPYVALASSIDNAGVREYVAAYLAKHHCPVVAFLHLPDKGETAPVLITGYDDGADAVLVHSHRMSEEGSDSVRVTDWERDILAIVGIGEGTPKESELHPAYITIQNALRYAKSHTNDGKHYGLNAYDAWASALLNDANFDGVPDEIVARRLGYHSILAGSIACQKAFTAFPEVWDAVPCMGIVSGLIERARLGPQIIHGLMWDVWHVVGGYWKGLKGTDSGLIIDDPKEIARFRDRGVRERAVAVIRDARHQDDVSLADITRAKAEWDACRGHGGTWACPCMDKGCTRVQLPEELP